MSKAEEWVMYILLYIIIAHLSKLGCEYYTCTLYNNLIVAHVCTNCIDCFILCTSPP